MFDNYDDNYDPPFNPFNLIKKFAERKDQIIAEVSTWTELQCHTFLEKNGGTPSYQYEGEDTYVLNLEEMRNIIIQIRVQLDFPIPK